VGQGAEQKHVSSNHLMGSHSTEVGLISSSSVSLACNATTVISLIFFFFFYSRNSNFNFSVRYSPKSSSSFLLLSTVVPLTTYTTTAFTTNHPHPPPLINLIHLFTFRKHIIMLQFTQILFFQ